MKAGSRSVMGLGLVAWQPLLVMFENELEAFGIVGSEASATLKAVRDLPRMQD